MRKELGACLTNTVLTLLQLTSKTKYRTAYECLASVRRVQARFLFRDSIGRLVWYAVVLHDGRRWTVDGGRSVHDCGVPNDQSRVLDSRVLGLDEAIISPPRRRTCRCVFGDSASWAETRRSHGRGQQSVLSTPRAGRRSIACSPHRTVSGLSGSEEG